MKQQVGDDCSSSLLLLLFHISLSFVYIFFHWCATRIIICCWLHLRIFNQESKYGTLQLLTSDSSCLISCLSRSQPRSSILHSSIYVPRITWWGPVTLVGGSEQWPEWTWVRAVEDGGRISWLGFIMKGRKTIDEVREERMDYRLGEKAHNLLVPRRWKA